MFNLTPLGTAQVNGAKQIIGTSVIVGTTAVVLYTCPAGKKAEIKAFTDRSVALGANVHQHATISGTNLRDMSGVEAGNTSEGINGFTMNAGDTITLVGDNAANNGTINFFISLVELPA